MGKCLLVSVIVPVYNVKPYLNKCIESIVKQSYRNLEIILIDDGSDDGSSEICDLWSLRDGRIRVIHQENRGLSGARNSGIDVSSGDYILFVDSDDLVGPDLVSHCIEVMSQTDSDVCVFRFNNVSENGKECTDSRYKELFPKEKTLSPRDAIKQILLMRLPNYAWSYMSRASLLKGKVYFPQGKVMEDLATTYLIWGGASRIAFLDEACYFYRVRSGSILASKNIKFIHDCKDNLEQLTRDLRQLYPELYTDAVNMFIQYLINFLFILYQNKKDSPDAVYRNETKNVKREIGRQINNIGLAGVSTLNIVKLIFIRLGLLRIMVSISNLRNKRV